MIRVLVVDDEKVVRQGLITSLPWERFGMRVVGEAKNGEKAIEFLQEREVDLMLTDLAMPVMSGIELMRVVRGRWPDVRFVVLTMHQDFEYIQEALRLGAIDYIAKVELKKDQFETILARIASRMAERRASGGGALEAGRTPSESYAADESYALVRLDRGGGESGADSDSVHRLPQQGAGLGLEEAGPGLWLCLPDAVASAGERLLELAAGEPGFALMHLRGLRGMRIKEAKRRLQAYADRGFFYDYDPNEPVCSVCLGETSLPDETGSEDQLADLRKKWTSHEWVYDSGQFEALLGRLKRLRLPQVRLIGLLYSLADEWNRLFAAVEGVAVGLPGRLAYWYEAEAWLHRTREAIGRIVGRQPYSPEVVRCIMKAVALIREEIDRPITAGETAQRVNMSRSYFNQCFKEITGRTFSDFVRDARIEKAKELLLYSNKPVQWIAEHTGYRDEKYFSRLFRDQIGLLPSEYRQAGRKWEKSPEGREPAAREGEI